ncbi:MAG: fibronectin type III domain-containing protein [Muribaculaceae bacterium]|nr:fibronectin type III domain-containing protein [Muribaculaceae bacterium]
MKKLVTFLVLTGLWTAGANAQAVYGYSPEVTNGTYTPLESPTVIYNGADEEEPAGASIEGMVFTPSGVVKEASEVTGYEIGFDFPFAGKDMKSFAVAGKGFIILGNDEFQVAPGNSDNFFDAAGFSDALGCVPQRGACGLENTVISYELTDDALVIQFENFGMMLTFFGDATPVNMQARLGKNGSISYIFDSLSELTSNLMLTCAVRQGDLYTCLGGTLDAEITKRYNASDILAIPPTKTPGITLLPPVKCVVPSSQPTDLKLSATSTTINGSFATVEDADNYLVVYAATEDFSFEPVNGTYYTTDEELEGCKVAYYGSDDSFTNEKLAGGTTYYYKVYAVNAYGLDGPVYNLTSPLAGNVVTLPAGCEASVKDADLTSIAIDAVGNEAGDDIVILYNTYCNRDNYGDKGLFVTPGADAKVGDVLPVPEDYNPMLSGVTMPAPENAGTVAYIGKAKAGIEITGLDSSTGYYFAVLSRNEEGACSSEIVYLDAATTIVAPYDGNSVNFPRYIMPQGWSTSEANAEARTFAFRDEAFINPRAGSVSQGTQIIQQRAQLTRGNAEGMTVWMTPQPVDVNDRHIIAKFDVAITESASRFDTHAYNDWAEGDTIEILVSEDNGQTWDAVTTLTPENKPDFGYDEELRVPTYTPIEADLNAYRGKTVLVKFQWTTYTIAGFGANMYVDRFSVEQGAFPDVPEVSVGDVTSETAVINWKSSQTDYELAYSIKGADDETTVEVKGANSYKIEGLTPETEYTVRVRGVLEGEDGYSEWSDYVDFTTVGWPAVDAPTDLESNLDEYDTYNKVALSWKSTEEMESFEVAFRESSSTEWEYVTVTEPTVTLENLKAKTRYVWKVRAFCTHDRTTDYSAQANFTTPDNASGVNEILSDSEAEIFTIDGLKVSKDNLKSGIYIVKSANGTRKVAIKSSL